MPKNKQSAAGNMQAKIRGIFFRSGQLTARRFPKLGKNSLVSCQRWETFWLLTQIPTSAKTKTRGTKFAPQFVLVLLNIGATKSIFRQER